MSSDETRATGYKARQTNGRIVQSSNRYNAAGPRPSDTQNASNPSASPEPLNNSGTVEELGCAEAASFDKAISAGAGAEINASNCDTCDSAFNMKRYAEIRQISHKE